MSIQEWLQISIRTKGRAINHRYLDELKEIEDPAQWTAVLFARLDEAVNMRDVLSADLVIQLMALLECGKMYRGITFSDVEGVKRRQHGGSRPHFLPVLRRLKMPGSSSVDAS